MLNMKNKYFKIDIDSRQIIIDKNKKYNVNIDIINLIIDLQKELNKINLNWEELKQVTKNYKYTNTCHCYNCNKELCDILLDKMEELERD